MLSAWSHAVGVIACVLSVVRLHAVRTLVCVFVASFQRDHAVCGCQVQRDRKDLWTQSVSKMCKSESESSVRDSVRDSNVRGSSTE